MTMFVTRRLWWWAVCCLLLAGCSGSATTDSGLSDSGLVPVTLALNWYPEAEHGGYYAAQVHGYYREQGLDVTIVPGGPNAPVIQQVARGAVEFGVTNADRVAIAWPQDAHVVALLAPLPTSPRCLIVHADSGITSFDQLNDVTLMMSRELAWAQFVIQYLDGRSVRIVPNTASLAPFLADKRAAKQGYVISEPFVAQSQGVQVRPLIVAELGFNPYTSLLVTSERRVQNDPELVRKMVQASQQGWQKYLESPETTNRHIHQQNPEMSLEILQFGVEAIKQHCLNGDAPPGHMTSQRWQTLIHQLEKLGMIELDSVPVERLFTAQFLPAPKGG